MNPPDRGYSERNAAVAQNHKLQTDIECWQKSLDQTEKCLSKAHSLQLKQLLSNKILRIESILLKFQMELIKLHASQKNALSIPPREIYSKLQIRPCISEPFICRNKWEELKHCVLQAEHYFHQSHYKESIHSVTDDEE